MVLVWDLGAVLNVASGVLMGALGVALLFMNPRKDWNRLFGLLAVFWGIQIVTANTVRLTDDPGTALFAGHMSLAFLIPLYFFVAAFASVFPRPRPPLGTSALAVSLLAVPAAAALVVLFLRPELLIADVIRTARGTLTLRWGPLHPYLVTAPFFGSFLFALFVMMRRLTEAASTIERRQITFVAAALGLYVAYYTPIQLANFGSAALGAEGAPEAAPGEAVLYALIMAASLVLVGALAFQLLRRWRAAPSTPEGREARTVLAVLGAALVAALTVLAVRAGGGPRIDVLGLFRSGSVALIVYAVARYQLFDIDLRTKHAMAIATAVVAVVTFAAAVYFVLREVSPSPSLRTVVAAVVALAAFVPVLRVTYRLADRLAPRVSVAGDHLYLRKLEVYRAAVEEQLHHGLEPKPEDPDLSTLREQLGLTEREHGVVVTLAASRVESSTVSPDLRPGAVVFGKYEIDSMIAEGGFGRVFLARDRILGRPVVIKELLAKWRENAAVVRTFLREAQVAGQLNHPNVVSVFAAERHGEDHYLIMEYVPGGTLEDRLAGGNRLPLAEALRLAEAVLGGLAAAHAQGVVHRDVKPSNVLLGDHGEVKLTDFGIAQLAGGDLQHTITGLTTGGFHPGTLQYMSPEQARGRAMDHRSDLYAVGALLHRMVTGAPHLDLEGLDELDARTRIADGRPPPPMPGVPDELNTLVARALAKEPDQRFGSARELVEALGAIRVRVGARA